MDEIARLFCSVSAYCGSGKVVRREHRHGFGLLLVSNTRGADEHVGCDLGVGKV